MFTDYEELTDLKQSEKDFEKQYEIKKREQDIQIAQETEEERIAREAQWDLLKKRN